MSDDTEERIARVRLQEHVEASAPLFVFGMPVYLEDGKRATADDFKDKSTEKN